MAEVNDMSKAAAPRSDQANFEDFLGGVTKTIKITKVTIKPGEQPVSIFYENDEGKPYKPCKTACKILVAMWGPDANKYVGRSLTLYGDPTVTWAGLAVGGIRISHMSNIDKTATMALAASRSVKKVITIQPLVVTEKPATITADQQKELAALVGSAGIAPAEFYAAFSIKRSAELLAEKMEEAREWIAQKQTAKVV